MGTASAVIVVITVVVLGSGAIEERTWDPFPPGNPLTYAAARNEVATPFSPAVPARLGATHLPPAPITDEATPTRNSPRMIRACISSRPPCSNTAADGVAP